MSENIKVKDLIDKVNTELKISFEKPVIKDGYRKYDTANGRVVRDINDVLKIIREIVDNGHYSFYTEKFDIELYKTPLRFKTKRKKSGMISYKNTDQSTVIEIYVENEDLLEKTIKMIQEETDEQKRLDEQKELNQEEIDKMRLINSLKEHSMSLKEFKSLIWIHKELSYSKRQEIEDAMK